MALPAAGPAQRPQAALPAHAAIAPAPAATTANATVVVTPAAAAAVAPTPAVVLLVRAVLLLLRLVVVPGPAVVPPAVRRVVGVKILQCAGHRYRRRTVTARLLGETTTVLLLREPARGLLAVLRLYVVRIHGICV